MEIKETPSLPLSNPLWVVQHAGVEDPDSRADSSAVCSGTLSKMPCAMNPYKYKLIQANQHRERGNRLARLGQYDMAVEEYTAAIDIYPEDVHYYTNRSACYLKMQMYEEAVEDCACALVMDSREVKAYYRRMLANECMRNYAEALSDCTSILTIDPKHAKAQKALLRLSRALKLGDGGSQSKQIENLGSVADFEIKHPCGYTPSAEPDKSRAFDSKITDKERLGPTAASVANGKPVEYCLQTIESAVIGSEISPPDYCNDDRDLPILPYVLPSIAMPVATKLKRPLPPPPTNSARFYLDWSVLTHAEKYQYLKSIEIPKLDTILGASFNSDTLSNIIHILRDYYVPNGELTTAATLLEVSKNGQIGILSMFMSNADRSVLRQIWHAIRQHQSSSTAANAIYRNFNLNSI